MKIHFAGAAACKGDGSPAHPSITEDLRTPARLKRRERERTVA